MKTTTLQNLARLFMDSHNKFLKAKKPFLLSIFAFVCFHCVAFCAPTTIPTVNLSLSAPDTPAQLVTSLNVVVVLTLLILAPSLVLVMTSFMRLAIVFSFLRTALGTQQSPPTQILVSLALVLTFFIMEPVGKEAWEKGVKPYIDEKISYDVAFVGKIKESRIYKKCNKFI